MSAREAPAQMTLTRRGNTFRSSLQHGSGEDKFTGQSEDKLLAKHFALNWTMINRGPVPLLPRDALRVWKMTSPGQGSRAAADGLLFQSRLAGVATQPPPNPSPKGNAAVVSPEPLPSWGTRGR